jgi:hypothetical protein
MKTNAMPPPDQFPTREPDYASGQQSASIEILTLAQAVKWIGEIQGWGSFEINRLAWFVSNEPTVSLTVSLMCAMIPHCKDVFAQTPNAPKLPASVKDIKPEI